MTGYIQCVHPQRKKKSLKITFHSNIVKSVGATSSSGSSFSNFRIERMNRGDLKGQTVQDSQEVLRNESSPLRKRRQ